MSQYLHVNELPWCSLINTGALRWHILEFRFKSLKGEKEERLETQSIWSFAIAARLIILITTRLCSASHLGCGKPSIPPILAIYSVFQPYGHRFSQAFSILCTWAALSTWQAPLSAWQILAILLSSDAFLNPPQFLQANRATSRLGLSTRSSCLEWPVSPTAYLFYAGLEFGKVWSGPWTCLLHSSSPSESGE